MSNPKYLTKSFNTYLFKKRVPKSLQDNPLYQGKTFIQKSLDTDSLSEAIRLRDIELAKIERIERGDFLSEREEILRGLVEQNGNPLTMTPTEKDELSDLISIELDYAIEPYKSYVEMPHGFKSVYDSKIDKDAYVSALVDYQNELDGKDKAYDISFRESLLKTIDLRSDGVNKNRLERYNSNVEQFLKFLNIDDVLLTNINRKMVLAYIESLRSQGLTDKTISNKVSIMSVIYQTAVDYNFVPDENPFKNFNLSQSVTNKRAPYSQSEVKKIYDYLPEDSKLIWKILYYTGLRPKELFQIKPENIISVEAKNCHVTCFSVAPDGNGKTENATRLIPVHFELLDDLSCFDGFSISQSTFEKRRRMAVIEAFSEGFAKTHDTYSLRHTFTTILVNELGNADLVKWLVGHSRAGNVTFHSYFHGYGLEKLKEAVDCIPVFSEVVQEVQECFVDKEKELEKPSVSDLLLQ